MDKEKKRIYQKEYRKKHPEKRKIYDMKYRLTHKKEIKYRDNIYRSKNKEKERIRHKKYRESNIEKKRHGDKIYRENNKEKRKISRKEYNSRPEVILHKKEYEAIRYLKNKEKVKEYNRNRYIKKGDKIRLQHREYKKSDAHKNNIKNKLKTDPLFRLNYVISRALQRSLKVIGSDKNSGWRTMLGYDNIQLKQHLEKQFTSVMNWENYGTFWHIDHIIPLSWFKTKEQLIKVGWRLSNLQPLERKINIEKGNNYVGNPKTNIDIICL